MRSLSIITLCLLSVVLAGAQAPAQVAGAGWVRLLDGTTLKGWNTNGNANWTAADGAIEASSGTGMLVTPATYATFELAVEFWVDAPANSGVFLRCSDPTTINQNLSLIHISEPTRLLSISYAVFCLKK